MRSVEKMLTYALGRGVDYYDAPVVRQILRDVEPTDYKWSAIISGIVKSTPFQMRLATAPTSPPPDPSKSVANPVTPVKKAQQ